MEILIALVGVVLVGSLIYFNRSSKSLDINNDGKVDLSDAKAAVKNTVAGVTAVADANKDGKVDAADAKVVVEKAKTGVKKAATKAKEAVKKASSGRGRKPRSKA
jgi:hypothetical protein